MIHEIKLALLYTPIWNICVRAMMFWNQVFFFLSLFLLPWRPRSCNAAMALAYPQAKGIWLFCRLPPKNATCSVHGQQRFGSKVRAKRFGLVWFGLVSFALVWSDSPREELSPWEDPGLIEIPGTNIFVCGFRQAEKISILYRCTINTVI